MLNLLKRRKEKETLTFRPFLSMNRLRWPCDCAAGGHRHWRPSAAVQPELLREGRLVEVMPGWHFSSSISGGPSWQSLHHAARACIQEFATQMAPTLFPNASDFEVDIGVFSAIRA